MDGKLPDISVDTSKYNKGFVNFCMIVGLIASIKLASHGVKAIRKHLKKNRELTNEQFLERYG